MKTIDIDKTSPAALVGDILIDREPRLVIAKGREAAVLLPYEAELNELLDAHEHVVGGRLEDARADVATLGLASLQIGLTGERDAFVYASAEGEPVLCLVGMQRYESFLHGGGELEEPVLSALVAELARAMTLQLHREAFVSRTWELRPDEGEPALFDLLLGMLLVGIEIEAGAVVAKEAWREVFRRFQQEHLRDDVDESAARLFLESAEDVLDHWHLYEDDDPVAAVLRATAGAAFLLPPASSPEHAGALEHVVEELRRDTSRFLDRVQRIVRGEVRAA